MWGDNTIVPMYDNEDLVCGIIYNGEPYYFQFWGLLLRKVR